MHGHAVEQAAARRRVQQSAAFGDLLLALAGEPRDDRWADEGCVKWQEQSIVGIGRREFLAIFGGELAAIAALGRRSACVTYEDVYFNRSLGVAFRKPKTWFFNSVRELGEVAKGQLLNLDAEVLKAFVDDSLQHLVVSISEAPLGEDAGRFTCGINVFLEKDGKEEDEVIANAEEEIRIQRKFVPEFCVSRPIEARTVSNCPGAEYIAEFRFDHESLASPVIARQHSLLIVQDGWRHTFRMYDAPSLGARATFDFSPVVSSIAVV